MTALILIALAAAAPQGAAADTDLRCYRLMAELARADDPSARALGFTAAGYFLGRIDSAEPGADLSRIAAIAEAERPELLVRCTQALEAGGFDPSGGASLEPDSPTS
jgi:hypothetical protein